MLDAALSNPTAQVSAAAEMNRREGTRGQESPPGKVLVTGANGFTGAWFRQYLTKKGVPTRGRYWAPDGAPKFSHPNLELVPGDLLDRESLKRALDGLEIVQNIAALYRPTNVP
jgi:uncharacterized protein YbjT (DUF2867 family)